MNVKNGMLAAVLYGREELRVERVEIPKLEPSDVLVKVQVALTCGTDLHLRHRPEGVPAGLPRPHDRAAGGAGP